MGKGEKLAVILLGLLIAFAAIYYRNLSFPQVEEARALLKERKLS